MGLHHAKKGAAVKKYGPLVTEGKTAYEVKAEIAKDDALAPFVDEVYDAIVAGNTPKEPVLVDHVVTQEDLDANPELTESGVLVGDTIQIPEKEEEKPATTPKGKKAKGHVVITQFRDKDNFAKLYEVGEDVSHFDEARKADLVNRKLIEAI